MFEKIEGQGSQLDQVVMTAKQHLEAPVIEKIIQDPTEREAQVKQQVEAARVNLEAFEEALPRLE